jgi:hypothetical protein
MLDTRAVIGAASRRPFKKIFGKNRESERAARA